MAYINASKDAGLKKNRITKRETSGYVNASKSKDDEKNRGGLLGGTGYVLGNAALGFSGVMEGVADIGAATGDLLRGDTSMAKYRFLDNNTAEAQQKLAEWYNPNKAMQFAGDVSSGIGNSLVFMIPYAGPYLAAAGYSGMGISGAAEKTGDVGGKEIAYGIASGGLEFALEKLTGGIGRASKNLSAAVTRKLGRESVEATAKAAGRSAASLAGKVTGKGLAGTVLKETAKGALGEGVEESLSELIDPGLQRLFNIDEDAEVDFKNVLYAGLVGAVSGGLMTAGPAAINYKSAVKTGREIREKGEAEELVRFARDTVLKAAERKQGKHKAAAEAAKVPTDAGALKRFAGAVNPLSEARKQTRAGKRVDGIADTVKKNLDTYERYMQNPNKTAKELEISDAVLGELRGNLFILENATLMEMYEESIMELGAEDKQEFVDRINRMAKADGREKFDYTIADLDKNTDDILTTIAGEYMMEDQYGNLLKDLKRNASAEQGTGDAARTVVQATEGEGAAKVGEVSTQPVKAAQRRYTGIGAVRIEGGKQVKDLNLSNDQYAAYKAAEILAPSLGSDIEIHTNMESDGNQVNGRYDPKTNTIHININAVRNGKQVALYTLGHEVTHNIKEWAPEKFSALADFVAEHLGESRDSLIVAKRESLERLKLLEGLTEQQATDLAMEEVVADGMELILADGKVLSDLAKKDRTLWQKVKAWIQNIIAKIKKAYGELNQASKTARVLKETLDSLEEVERLFTEGVTEAGERARTAGVETETNIDDGNAQDGREKLSVDDIDNRTFTYKELVQRKQDKFSKNLKYSIEESTTEDAFEDAVRRMEESETVEEPTVTSTGKSFREVLAEALEGSIETDAEYRVLREYADSIERLDGLQRQVNDLNIMAADLRDKQFHSPDEAVRSAAAKELQELYKERNRIEDEMAKGDGKITKLRQTEPIRNLMKSVERSAKDNFEAKEKTRSQSSEITSRVRTVRRILGTLNTMLYHPNKQKHVPDALRDLTEVALRSQDPKAFSRNRDHIRELAELSEKIERLEKKVARTALEQERLDKMKSRYEFLEADTISTKRQAEALLTAFEEYQRNTTDDMTFDKALIDNMREHVKKIEEATLSEMTLQSVTAVEDFYRMLKHQVDNVNTTFATERALNIDDLGKKSADETRETKDLKFLSPKGNEWVAMDGIRKFFWKNVKPLTVFEAIGSGTFLDLFKRVMDGEEVWALDILEAREKILEAREKHGYKEWELDKREAVKTKSGTVSLSLSERMALYAYSFREQAISHLEGGGFILDTKATVKDKALSTITIEKRLNDSTRYVMDAELMGELADTLTDPQKEYVREMQSYLTKLGEKGNEVSLKLYGLKLFTEKYYFPIKVRSEYIASQTGKSGDPNIKNRGMTKEVVPNAKDPLVLQGFDNIMVDHINSMATYHAFVLPIEDLTRVLNYKPVNYLRDENGNVVLDADGKPKVDADAENDYSTLKAVIQSKYGEAANNYIVQLIRDLNGGARRDAAAGIIDRGITAFKRASTMASLSVLVQQPTSLVRAAAYIEPKYLFGNASIVDFKNHKELWERVKKYAPVAIIKEMGGYDTGVGARTGDYLNAAEYGRGERLKGFATDANYRAEVFGKGAAYADEMAWIQMFEACVSEQADKRGKPRDSEEVLKAAGKRFTEIIRHTQVYDSTLTRSEYMRSKDTGAKMVTDFMAEPSTVVSMVAEALMRFERGDVKFLRSTAGAVIGSVILNALFSSLVYAMRDDDEDKSYEEKYLSTLAMETAEGFNPAEYLPYARDIMSLVKGYEIERSDMTLIGDLVNSIRRITSSNQSVSQKMMNTGSAVAAFFGLPVTNIRRDVNGAIYTFFKQTDTERFTQKGLSVALKEKFDTMWGLWDDETTNGYQLYQSVLDGDSRHFARVAARFDTDKAVEMALRKALRDYDPRINEAAIARIEGELDVYESIVKQIEAEGHFDRNITIRAINNEINYIKDHMEDDTVPKADDAEEENESIYESLYNTSDLNAALEREDKGNFADVYASLLTDKIAAGKTEAQAKSSIRSSITAYWKKQYIAAWEANDTAEIKRIQSILLSTGLYGSRNDVAEMGQGWVKAYAASKTKK